MLLTMKNGTEVEVDEQTLKLGRGGGNSMLDGLCFNAMSLEQKIAALKGIISAFDYSAQLSDTDANQGLTAKLMAVRHFMQESLQAFELPAGVWDEEGSLCSYANLRPYALDVITEELGECRVIREAYPELIHIEVFLWEPFKYTSRGLTYNSDTNSIFTHRVEPRSDDVRISINTREVEEGCKRIVLSLALKSQKVTTTSYDYIAQLRAICKFLAMYGLSIEDKRKQRQKRY